MEKPHKVKYLMVTDYWVNEIPDLDTFRNLESLVIFPVTAKPKREMPTVVPPLGQLMDTNFVYEPWVDTVNVFSLPKSLQMIGFSSYGLELSEFLRSKQGSDIDSVFCPQCKYDSTLNLPFAIFGYEEVESDTVVNNTTENRKTYTLQMHSTFIVFPSRQERRRFKKQTGLHQTKSLLEK